jgi:hypothetical protein
MSLVTETGAGLANAESYCSVSDADAYHANRGNAAWALALDQDKEAALRNATTFLEGRFGQFWGGYRVTQSQALSWPRYGTYYSDGMARQSAFLIPQDVVPPEIRDACARLALSALAGDLLPDIDRGGQIKRERIGPIEVEYESGADTETSRPWLRAILARLLPPINRLIRA